jgi:hypothetical protein
MKRWKYILTLFIWIIILPIWANDSDDRAWLLKYASQRLIDKNDALVFKYQGNQDKDDMIMREGLQIKSTESINIDHRPYIGCILGCWGLAEFILVDSTVPDTVFGRAEFDIPGFHAYFKEVGDINGDGIREIEIDLSGGAYGYHAMFLTLELNNLHFLTFSGGITRLYASTGGIDLIPTEKPNIFDIRVDKEPVSGQTASFTTYKWNGKNYESDTTLSKPEK